MTKNLYTPPPPLKRTNWKRILITWLPITAIITVLTLAVIGACTVVRWWL